MSQSLNVEPERLHMSADRLDMHRADHIAAHNAASAKIESAMTGWVGSSAAALVSKSTDWQAQALHVTNELTHYRDAFDKCGYAFQTVDEQSAINIFRARPSGM